MKKILIVEDDQSIANLQKDYLELSGYSVMIVNSGNEGLKALEQAEFELIILDIMLPGMDGFEVLRAIREQDDIPVLLVSARAEEIYKINGLGLGADDYITKPFSSGELVARVNAHLKKFERMKERFGREPAEVKLQVRGLEIQKDARRVLVNGHEVMLAQKEFDLLLFLAQHPNRVFSKDELFERIWGMDALGDTSTVTVHIARIREKIEEHPSKPQYIGTVWGSGYRFMV
ncbi:DNA-binding response regulator, OmpR family, contains REC and winged-helix (wHTH) domain [Paenibacillus sp. UNCCL117]|uniref:response regulator transcription factor n=1 Tax=unclassified Paenibacillus TaxID=185978 RepID=UPI0008853279|nr:MULTISPECIES: response regulator transcription factor [unclassified Paenibacillus]SDC15593.1 DNA-binding response regulator, OmpR family, contains REC and winged-helix (wHTH) domain [Paenibacillus sp. cl123]SFW17586.1 DNA-binding response regulator, OmpR family, contains REC and winged-helix (wHTH) domain [Paenibacillus sp. UNCCL117]